MAQPPAGDPLEGNDRYRTIKHLNAGAFGFVVLAEEVGGDKEKWAIKFLERGNKITKVRAGVRMRASGGRRCVGSPAVVLPHAPPAGVCRRARGVRVCVCGEQETANRLRPPPNCRHTHTPTRLSDLPFPSLSYTSTSAASSSTTPACCTPTSSSFVKCF